MRRLVSAGLLRVARPTGPSKLRHSAGVGIASFVAGAVLASAVGVAAVGGGDADSKPTVPWLTAKVSDALGKEGVTTWVPSGSFATSADVRVPRYPFQIDGKGTTSLSLSAVRNEQVSAQLAVAATTPLGGLTAGITDLRGPAGALLPKPQLRYVSYVPVMRSKSELTWSAKIEDVSSEREVSGDRNPDVVGDALVARESLDVPAYAAQPLWFTFKVPTGAAPGAYTATIAVTAGGKTVASYPLRVDVADAAIPDPAKGKFFLDVWAQPETIAAAAGVKTWSKEHWKLIAAYQRDLAASGQRVVNTTIVDDPWKHEWSTREKRSQTYLPYQSMVKWKYDGLNFTFDFGRFDNYVQTALRAGVGPRIHAYSMLAFHDGEHLTYKDTRKHKVVREDVTLGGTRWQEAWGDFLAAFQAHLTEKGWLDQTWLAFDERPLATMSVVRDFVAKVAPVFNNRIAIAGSANVAALAGNVSLDWGGIDGLTPEQIAARRAAGKLTTFYVYGSPAHPNTLSYSPAVEARMLPWIASQRRLDGFLRWSFNSWTNDVFREPVYIFSQGDEYMIYPDARGGPASSVRWEQLREGIEDFELVHVARARHGGADTEALKQALALATRNLDGRTKDVKDLAEARRLVIQDLTAPAKAAR